MYEFEVGKPFPLPLIPSDGAIFSVEPYSFMLIYYLESPSEEEIRAFKEGRVELSITELKKILVIQSRFGSMGWADAFYSAALPSENGAKAHSLPELTENQRGYALDTFLVDRASGELKVHRLVRMPRDFSLKFRLLLKDNEAWEIDGEAFDTAVEELQRSYSSRELLKRSLMKASIEKAPPVEKAED